jgi:hypothetical protein
MTITVNIPDDLLHHAGAIGLSAEEYVQGLIEDAARTSESDIKPPRQDIETFFREMAANSDAIPLLPDEAFTRESFYRDHD